MILLAKGFKTLKDVIFKAITNARFSQEELALISNEAKYCKLYKNIIISSVCLITKP